MIKMGKKEDYKEKLRTLIIDLGEWNINFLQLSKEWEIPKTTLYRWRDEIIEEIGFLDLKDVGRNIQQGFKRNIKLCNSKIISGDTKIQFEGIRLWNESVEHLTDFLEAYGYKKKVAEEVNSTVDVSWAIEEAYKRRLQKIKEQNGKS